MTPRVERSIGAAVLAAIVLAGLFLMTTGGEKPNESDDSIDSSRPDGRRALWLMLSELGFDPVRWDEAPNRLPRGNDVLWLSRVPTDELPGARSATTGVKREGLHALDHYREFVESGGTLVLCASARATQFLADDLGFEDCRSVRIDTGRNGAFAGDCALRTGDGEDTRIESDGTLFAPLEPGSPARELWTATCATTSRPFLVSVPEGAGSVVLLPQDAWLRNASIGKGDHALAAARLAERVMDGGRLLIDAYETGSWSPPSIVGLLFSPRFALTSLNVLACLGLFVWMHAFARAFPRDGEPLELFSPLVRARSLGRVLARAERYPALATLMRRGVFARLSRRVPAFRSAAELRRGEPAGGARPATPIAADGLQKVTREEVAAFAASAGLLERRDELTSAFVTKPVLSRHDLESLDVELDRIRREIEAHLGAERSTRATGAEQRELSASGLGDTKGKG